MHHERITDIFNEQCLNSMMCTFKLLKTSWGLGFRVKVLQAQCANINPGPKPTIGEVSEVLAPFNQRIVYIIPNFMILYASNKNGFWVPRNISRNQLNHFW